MNKKLLLLGIIIPFFLIPTARGYEGIIYGGDENNEKKDSRSKNWFISNNPMRNSKVILTDV